MGETVQILSINHRHEAMADWLLANPTRKLGELAQHMGYSPSWVSTVMNSDMWKEYWAQRRKDYAEGIEDMIQRAQFEAVLKAWEMIPSVLADEKTDPRLVFDIASKTTERLFGGAPKTTVVEERSQEITRPVDASVLASARETLKRTVRTEYALPGPTEG